MKLILTSLLLFTVASQGQTYWLLDKNTDGIGSKPKVTAANSTIFGINSSGVLELLPQSTFAPVSTTVTTDTAQTITGLKTFLSSTGNAISITSTYGAAAIIGSGSGAGADISSSTGVGAEISSLSGNHINIGAGAIIVANDGTLTSTAAINATAFIGSGAGLTNLPASSLTGDIDRARINSALSANAASIVATTISGTTGTFSGAVTTTTSGSNIQATFGGISLRDEGSGQLSFNRVYYLAGTAFVMTNRYLAINDAFGGTNKCTISKAADGVLQLGTTASNALGSLLLTNLTASGNVICSTVGNGLQVKGGSALARAGNATLVAGTITVNNTTVTDNTVIILTRKTNGGTIGMAVTYTLSTGASFTITSDSALDTSTYSFLLLEVNP